MVGVGGLGAGGLLFGLDSEFVLEDVVGVGRVVACAVLRTEILAVIAVARPLEQILPSQDRRTILVQGDRPNHQIKPFECHFDGCLAS